MSELSREEVLKLAKEHGLFGGFRPLPCNESQVVWFATAIYNKAKREERIDAFLVAANRCNQLGHSAGTTTASCAMELRRMADELKGGEQG